MTEKEINQLRKFTDNIDVLKAIINDEKVTQALLNYAITIYSILITSEINFKQGIADKIVLALLKSNKRDFQTIPTILNYSFLEKMAIENEENITKLFSFYENEKLDFIFSNENILKNYSVSEIITLTSIYTQNYSAIFKPLIAYLLPVSAIKSLTEEYKLVDDYKKDKILEYLSKEETYQTNYQDIITIVHLICQRKNGLDQIIGTNLETILAIANAGFWCGQVSFFELYLKVIYYANTNNIKLEILYEPQYCDIFKHRDTEELKQMLELISIYPNLENVIKNIFLIENITWEEQRKLIIEFDLEEPKIQQGFFFILGELLTKSIPKEKLYETLKDRLENSLYYEITVRDYLEECMSITEFASSINYSPENAGISPTDIVKLKPKIFR